MAALAGGSDLGGSLRNPPNFCNVVGLRPSPGRVAGTAGFSPLPVCGPVARNVRDVALLLSVQAGFSAAAPVSLDAPHRPYHRLLERDFTGTRVALFTGWGLPWEPEVYAAICSQRVAFESLGCVVDDAEPDLRDADEVFVNLRHALVAASFATADLAARPDDSTIRYCEARSCAAGHSADHVASVRLLNDDGREDRLRMILGR